MAKIKGLEARVLSDIHALGARVGQVIYGAEAHIKSLAHAGLVDPEPAAVAYAKSVGGELVDVTDTAGTLAGELDAFEAVNGTDPDAEPAATDETPTA